MVDEIEQLKNKIVAYKHLKIKKKLSVWISENEITFNQIRRVLFNENKTDIKLAESVLVFYEIINGLIKDIDGNSKLNRYSDIINQLNGLLLIFQKANEKSQNVEWTYVLNDINQKGGFSFSLQNISLSNYQGTNNIIYSLSNENVLINIKISSQQKNDSLKNECRVIEYLKSSVSDFKIIPSLITHNFEPNGHYYIAYIYIKGTPLSKLRRTTALINEVCINLANLHSYNHKVGVGAFSNSSDKSWAIWLKKIIKIALKNLKKSGVLSLLSINQENINATYSRLDINLNLYFEQISQQLTNAPISLIHNDLIFSNILIDKGKVTAFIDWENAIFADPAWEFHGINFKENDAHAEYNMEFLACYLNAAQEITPGFCKSFFLKRYLSLTPLKNLYYANEFATRNLAWAKTYLHLFNMDFELKNSVDKFDSYYDRTSQKLNITN